MRTYPRIGSHSTVRRTGLRRPILTCGASLICLLGVLPSARAHEDGPVPPERVLWGLIAFVIMLTWILFMCLRAPRALRKKPYQARRHLMLPKWLEMILFFDPGAG